MVGAKGFEPPTPCAKNLWVFYTFDQLIRDIGAFDAHDAFLSGAVTQKIDAAIPHDFLIRNCEFLMDIGFKNNTDTIVFQFLQNLLHSQSIFGFKFLRRPGYHNCSDAFIEGISQLI